MIKRILFSTNKDCFDDNILNISVRTNSDFKEYIELKKTTIDSINIYENKCNILWNDLGVIIKLRDNSFKNLSFYSLQSGQKMSMESGYFSSFSDSIKQPDSISTSLINIIILIFPL